MPHPAVGQGAPAQTKFQAWQPEDRAAIEAHAKDVLVGGGFRFCRDPEYPLTKDEVRWCSALGETSEMCPALPAGCRAGATAKVVPSEAQREEPFSLHLPNLGALGSFLF